MIKMITKVLKVSIVIAKINNNNLINNTTIIDGNFQNQKHYKINNLSLIHI